MIKILSIIGARPQFIKAAALSKAIAQTEGMMEILVHTGQHFDANMSAVFFEEMGLPTPDYMLDIHSLSHGAMTGRMLEAIEAVIIKEKPQVVLVYGDTNSTLAGALAARKLHVKVAHVEAGLRSFAMEMPEEVNRIVTDRISDFLFCPTDSAVNNLLAEGFDKMPLQIHRTGDIMFDALRFFSAYAPDTASVSAFVGHNRFALCTLHRAENTDNPDRLRAIIDAINTLTKTIPVVLPLHPRTKKIMEQHDLRTDALLIDPVGYLQMLGLLQHCALVLTDSGGLQKEAYLSRKFCVTMRDQTEWVELCEAGVNKLCGADTAAIIKAANDFLSIPFTAKEGLYGDGNAANEIVRILRENL
jgi:UDP-GlcNAc3NAcA epimerase